MELTAEQLAAARTQLEKEFVMVKIVDYNDMRATAGKTKQVEESLKALEAEKGRLAEENKRLEQEVSGGHGGNIKKLREEITADVRKEHADKIAALETEAKSTREKLVATQVMGKIGARFYSSIHQVIRERVLKDCRLGENDQIEILDPSGNPRWSRLKPDQKMGVDEYQAELEAAFPEFVPSTTRAGDLDNKDRGTNTNGGGARKYTFQELTSMSEAELAKIPHADIKAAMRQDRGIV